MSHASTHDPYRDWLRTRLGQELGAGGAETAIEGAVLRRGWPALRPLGPRDVVAVLQDVYSGLRQTIGDTRADGWLQGTTQDLAEYAQTVPVPAQPTPGPLAPSPAPLRWGRRAHDLPLLLARAQAEMAGRNLAGIRADAELGGLEAAAEWDVQAAAAGVRRWETEEMLSSLRADHSRIEVADTVAVAAAEAEVMRLSVRELQDEMREGHNVAAKLAHSRLILTQLNAFLEVFPPLIDLNDADLPLAPPTARLAPGDFLLEVPLHPAVLRARHALKLAQWRAGVEPAVGSAVALAQRALEDAETGARAELETTLKTAHDCQARLTPLWQRAEALEERIRVLGQMGSDPLSQARVRLEWRQQRAAARVQAHRLEQALRLLEALADVPSGPDLTTSD
ncbi:hypothetical protein GCM10010840_09230 [Deinococcus aerolatus]|uniref:Uncharacterized protein n=1 Tax=Deinococcus aerolatus TaxID=522487 RepID=A0ABQ2G3B3_9DEIO|nr:hypothetical protein [Deinococcus aerolatus]GGL73344.1 hypothetical protein GCM10010840_09230 [Deinococcus aerolatus]